MNLDVSILKVIQDSGGSFTFRPDGSDLRALHDFQVTWAKVEEHFNKGHIEAILPHVTSRFAEQLVDTVVAQGLTEDGEEFLRLNLA